MLIPEENQSGIFEICSLQSTLNDILHWQVCAVKISPTSPVSCKVRVVFKYRAYLNQENTNTQQAFSLVRFEELKVLSEHGMMG